MATRLRVIPPAATEMAMLRFQLDRRVMMKRLQKDWIDWYNNRRHWMKAFDSVTYPSSLGHMRKHRVYESHPSSSCGLCAGLRGMRRRESRTFRYTKRSTIMEGLQ